LRKRRTAFTAVGYPRKPAAGRACRRGTGQAGRGGVSKQSADYESGGWRWNAVRCHAVFAVHGACGALALRPPSRGAGV